MLLTKGSPLMCFLTPWIFSKGTNPFPRASLFWFSKIHILKLWTSPKDPQTLVSTNPKSSLIWFPWDSPSLPNKWVMECLHSVQIQTKSCHGCQNRVTFPCVRPKVHKTYPQIVSCFPKSCHDLDIWKTCSLPAKIVTRLWNRVTISLFFQNTIWKHIQHSPPCLQIDDDATLTINHQFLFLTLNYSPRQNQSGPKPRLNLDSTSFQVLFLASNYTL